MAVVALLWVAAFAASSAPDGLGGAPRAEMPLLAGTSVRLAATGEVRDGPRTGKRWAFGVDRDGKRWDLPEDSVGKRWA